MTIIRHYQNNENNIGRIKFQLVINILYQSKLSGKIHFVGRFFRAFKRGCNNSYYNSTVRNSIMPENKISQHRLVLTGTISFLFLTAYHVEKRMCRTEKSIFSKSQRRTTFEIHIAEQRFKQFYKKKVLKTYLPMTFPHSKLQSKLSTNRRTFLNHRNNSSIGMFWEFCTFGGIFF